MYLLSVYYIIYIILGFKCVKRKAKYNCKERIIHYCLIPYIINNHQYMRLY